MKKTFPDPSVIHVSWPEPADLPLSTACENLVLRERLDELRASRAVMHALEKAPAPIVGVMGLLNAGKSSLVKQFLSPVGKLRVLSGIRAEQGTQRFVFWLPTLWKQEPAVWEAFKEELEAAFGNQLEELSEDPTRAAEQYNGGGDIAASFGTPLIAFDPGLDPYGFCLLDCPDFERVHPGAQGVDTASIRVDFIKHAARLLSAIIVLGERKNAASGTLLLPFTEREQIANGKPTRTAQDLRLDGKPVFLLLNKLNPHVEPTEAVLLDTEVRALMSSLGVERVFIAFDGWLDRADDIIPHVFRGTDKEPRPGYDRSLPYFFELSAGDGENAPAAVDESRMLEHHLASLRPAELWEAKRQAKAVELENGLRALENDVRKRLAEHGLFLSAARDKVIAFVRDQVRSGEKNQLAFPLLPETMSSITEALVATAPTYAKPAMWASRGFKHTLDFVKGARQLLTTKQALKDPGESVRTGAQLLKEKAKKSELRTFDPAEWARQSRNQKFMPDDVGEDTLTALWTNVQDFTMDLKVELDPQKVEAFAKGLWSEMPWHRKVMLGAMGPVFLIGALASVAFAALDGGASSIFLFFSLKELLIAVGLSGAAAATALKGGEHLEAHLVERAGIPFYTRLLKGTLDAFGLPRQGDAPIREHFSNTGEFEVNLDRQSGEASLPTMVNLSEGRMLGDISEPGWKTLREQIGLSTHTIQKI